MGLFVVSVMIKSARDNTFLMSESMRYEDAKHMLDCIEESIIDGVEVIRLSDEILVATQYILSVRIMPANSKGAMS